MDVRTTFLNGDLKKEVYIKQTKGFVKPRFEHLVYIFNKMFYEFHLSLNLIWKDWFDFFKLHMI
jgi:hypothetical protein